MTDKPSTLEKWKEKLEAYSKVPKDIRYDPARGFTEYSGERKQLMDVADFCLELIDVIEKKDLELKNCKALIHTTLCQNATSHGCHKICDRIDESLALTDSIGSDK